MILLIEHIQYDYTAENLWTFLRPSPNVAIFFSFCSNTSTSSGSNSSTTFLLFFFSSPSLRQLHISKFSRGLYFAAMVDEAKEEVEDSCETFLARSHVLFFKIRSGIKKIYPTLFTCSNV